MFPPSSGCKSSLNPILIRILTRFRDTYDHISLMEDTLADIRKANKAGGKYAGQFVVYDLPNRDCAAAASNGEYSLDKDGANKYKAYIAKIKGILQDYSDTKVILVIG